MRKKKTEIKAQRDAEAKAKNAPLVAQIKAMDVQVRADALAMAKTHIDRKEFEQARTILTRLAKENPEDAEAGALLLQLPPPAPKADLPPLKPPRSVFGGADVEPRQPPRKASVGEQKIEDEPAPKLPPPPPAKEF